MTQLLKEAIDQRIVHHNPNFQKRDSRIGSTRLQLANSVRPDGRDF